MKSPDSPLIISLNADHVRIAQAMMAMQRVLRDIGKDTQAAIAYAHIACPSTRAPILQVYDFPTSTACGLWAPANKFEIVDASGLHLSFVLGKSWASWPSEDTKGQACAPCHLHSISDFVSTFCSGAHVAHLQDGP